MKLTIGHVYAAAETVTAIINANRVMPGKGAYRLSRLYAKLKPEYDLILARRNAMIEAYGHKEMVDSPDSVALDGESRPPKVEAPNFSVPLDKMPEFTAAWAEVVSEEIEVDAQPIPLDQLGDAITAAEFVVLDTLVVE